MLTDQNTLGNLFTLKIKGNVGKIYFPHIPFYFFPIFQPVNIFGVRKYLHCGIILPLIILRLEDKYSAAGNTSVNQNQGFFMLITMDRDK